MPHLSRFLSGLALMLTLPLSGCLDTGPDVVCVDVERVLSQSKAARQANEHLGKVQTILRNGLAAYQEELKKSPEEKRQQELRQGLTLLQRQMALEQAAARDVVSKHMLAQIEAWRADKGDVAVMGPPECPFRSCVHGHHRRDHQPHGCGQRPVRRAAPGQHPDPCRRPRRKGRQGRKDRQERQGRQKRKEVEKTK